MPQNFLVFFLLFLHISLNPFRDHFYPLEPLLCDRWPMCGCWCVTTMVVVVVSHRSGRPPRLERPSLLLHLSHPPVSSQPLGKPHCQRSKTRAPKRSFSNLTEEILFVHSPPINNDFSKSTLAPDRFAQSSRNVQG